MDQPHWALEDALRFAGHDAIAGVDEAGRGALAGPVVVAAVVLPNGYTSDINDSKRLRPAQRELLANEIRNVALAYCVAISPVWEIAERNVLGATLHAAQRSLAGVRARIPITAAITDYLRVSTDLHIVAPAKADQQSVQVAAASILAKVVRDHYMVRLASLYPQFGFEHHKGYSAPKHVQALFTHGPCPEHRASFAPVAAAQAQRRLFLES